MKLKINNGGYHFNLFFEGIHRYNTKNTSIFTYFDSVVLPEIHRKEIFQKKKLQGNISKEKVFVLLLF